MTLTIDWTVHKVQTIRARSASPWQLLALLGKTGYAASMPKKEMLPPVAAPDIQHSEPEVFILESLSKRDEHAKRYEGMILCDILRLAGKNPKYFYFQSEDELPHLAGLFRQSRYRYLHISTHASDDSIGLTNGSLSYDDFANYFEGQLMLRRLFFSACEVGNKAFVNAIKAKNKGIHSIVAPVDRIRFDHAAAAWSALYISLFSVNANAMKTRIIKEKLIAIRMLFPTDFFFASYHANIDDWTYETIDKKSLSNSTEKP